MGNSNNSSSINNIIGIRGGRMLPEVATRDTRVVRGEAKTWTIRETLVADLACTKQEEASTLSEETTLIIRINYF